MAARGTGTPPPTQTLRFTPGLDVILLCEVVAVNPYGDTKRKSDVIWDEICQKVCSVLTTGKVTKRQCKDRTANLVKAHKADEMQSL